MRLLKKFIDKLFVCRKLVILFSHNSIIYDVYYTINQDNKLSIIANIRPKEIDTNIFIEIIGCKKMKTKKKECKDCKDTNKSMEYCNICLFENDPEMWMLLTKQFDLTI